jgi:four helix bundle protein
MSSFKSYKDLDAWKKSRELVKCVYELTKKYPKDEDFGLKLQMRRASISVLSNIAEGQGRQYKKEMIQFMYMSRGSLNELEAQLEVSFDLGYITSDEQQKTIEVLESCRKLLSGFINYLQKADLA